MEERFLLTFNNSKERPYWHIKDYDEHTDLETIQAEVGGYIEPVLIWKDLFEKQIVCFVDEEGKFKKLKPSHNIIDQYGICLDVIFGNICFLKYSDDGDTTGLSKDEVIYIIKNKKPGCDMIVARECSADVAAWGLGKMLI